MRTLNNLNGWIIFDNAEEGEPYHKCLASSSENLAKKEREGGRDRPEDMSVEMGGKRDQSCPDLREFTKWVDIWGWADTLLL